MFNIFYCLKITKIDRFSEKFLKQYDNFKKYRIKICSSKPIVFIESLVKTDRLQHKLIRTLDFQMIFYP